MFSSAVVDPACAGDANAHTTKRNAKRAKELSCSIDRDDRADVHPSQIKAPRCTAGSGMSVCYRTHDMERGIAPMGPIRSVRLRLYERGHTPSCALAQRAFAKCIGELFQIPYAVENHGLEAGVR